MGEKPGEMKSEYIKRSIDVQRDNLGRDIQELEDRVRTTFDWRAQFQKNPMTMIGAAFGGGVLLAVLLGNRRRGRGRSPYAESPGRSEHVDFSTREHERHPGTTYQRQKALDTWDNIKGALIGVAATRFRSLLGEAIPGFTEQYKKTEREKVNDGSGSMEGQPQSVPVH